MNEDIARLISKARESLDAATLLNSRDYSDFAASRSYYAMFYLAEALLASLGQSYSSHAAVLAAYGREFSKTAKLDAKFHRWLLDASDARNTADYGVGASLPPAQADRIRQRAGEFLRATEEFLRIHPDGERFVMVDLVAGDRGAKELVVVGNWSQELQRLLPGDPD